MNLKPILIKSNFAQNIVHIAKMAERPCHRMWHDLKSTEGNGYCKHESFYLREICGQLV